MSLANLWNVPTNKAELDTWSFVHMAHHRDIDSKIFRQFSVSVVEYLLDPIDPNDSGPWEYQHQLMHNAVNTILGTGGFDLSSVDFRDPTQLAGWIQSNAVEHRQWEDILGVD